VNTFGSCGLGSVAFGLTSRLLAFFATFLGGRILYVCNIIYRHVYVGMVPILLELVGIVPDKITSFAFIPTVTPKQSFTH
jgi:hypothetical protein